MGPGRMIHNVTDVNGFPGPYLYLCSTYIETKHPAATLQNDGKPRPESIQAKARKGRRKSRKYPLPPHRFYVIPSVTGCRGRHRMNAKQAGFTP